MATRSLDNQLQKYWALLEIEQKQSILNLIKSFSKRNNVPKKLSKDELITQYNKELDEAEARVKAGEFYTQEEVEEMS